MLSSELEASNDPKDVERYDTLLDVNMSCTAAVDILNDLLCYEKLDSGILTLHKENILILPFLNDCVSMFSAQARECGVTMSSVPNVRDVETGAVVDTNNYTTLPLSLQPHDTIFVDKFKMDQVIRNLISNALKFTPRGGAVTVKATFVPISNGTSNQQVRYRARPTWSSYIASGFSRKVQDTPTSPSHLNLKVTSALNSADGDFDGHLVVVVTDSGAGISAENQKRLFKDIVQFSPEKLQAGGGSGLGLWISGGIVDLHGGKISVHSRGENMGSSFTVEIPMVRLPGGAHCHELSFNVDEEARSAQDTDPDQIELSRHNYVSSFIPISPTPFASYSSHLSKRSGLSFELLVVDDSRLNRKMLLKCLQKGGHKCSEAEDGLEAIEKVKQRMVFLNGMSGSPYDVILMDFIMPNMDGPTAVKEIRSMGYTAPIFGLTGNGKL